MNDCGGLFDGVGLLAYGLHLAGWEHAWLCESDEWRRSILAKRWPGVPIVDDVRSVGGDSVRPVTLVAGGFPCKGASGVGKREGFGHPETVLWREMRRVVGELRPRYVLVENVANLLRIHGGELWSEVLGGLATLGYDTVWDCLPAAAVGAPHRRDRVFAVATYTERGVHGPTEPGRVLGEAGAGEGEAPERQWLRPHLADGGPASPDATGEPERAPHDEADAVAGRGRARQISVERDSAPAAHPASGPEGRSTEDATRRLAAVAEGVGVEWGDYEPAIKRWEAVHGSAPEPLVRGVDDRGAARVVRSRLSALGDGVQVQVGYLAGAYIAGLERDRMSAAA